MATTGETLALGWQHLQRGALEEAEQLYRQVLEAEPHHPEAHYFLGLALRRQGRLNEAVASFQHALQLRPDYSEAFDALGASFQQAVQFRPDSAEVCNDLGVPLLRQGRLEEALASFQQALRLKPNFAEAYINIGAVLKKQGKLDEAAASIGQALQWKPDSADAHNDLGGVLGGQGKWQEALASFKEAVRRRPEWPDAHNNLGILWLLLGHFEQGWPEYEWRWQTNDFHEWRLQANDFPPQPAWDGSPLRGRTILLKPEQGVGDTLQFIRYAPLVQKGGGRVVVGSCPLLRSLLPTCPGIDHLVAAGEPLPSFDVHAYLLSLPGLLNTTLANVPADVPYLSADSALVAHWRRELNTIPGFKIGIVWQGNPEHKQDRQRSVPPQEFAPLAELAGVHLFSLQVGPGSEELAALAGRFPVTDLGGRFDPTSFADAAAVIMNLDLIVTVDTALAHLAGALGAPAWLALPFAPDWRWLLGREDSPWYPSLRLFRQARPGAWGEVFANMAAELAKVLAQRAHG